MYLNLKEYATVTHHPSLVTRGLKNKLVKKFENSIVNS